MRPALISMNTQGAEHMCKDYVQFTCGTKWDLQDKY